MLDAAQRVLGDADAQPLAVAGDAARAPRLRLGSGRGRVRRRAARCCSTTSSATAAPACAPTACSMPDARRARCWSTSAGCRLPAIARCRTVPRPHGHASNCAACWRRRRRPASRSAPAMRPRRRRLADDARRPGRDRRARPACRCRWRRACCASIRRCRSATNATSTCCPTPCRPNATCGYAVQWFALALAVLVTALVLTFRKRRRSKHDHATDAPAQRSRNRIAAAADLRALLRQPMRRRRAALLRLAAAGQQEPRRTAAAAGRPARAGAAARRRQRVSHGIRARAPGGSWWRRRPTAATRLRRRSRATSTRSGSCSARMPTACTCCGSARRLPACRAATPRRASCSPTARCAPRLPRVDERAGERAGVPVLRDRSERLRDSALRSRLRSGRPARGRGQAAEADDDEHLTVPLDRIPAVVPAFPPHRLARGRAGAGRDRVRRLRAPVQCRPELPRLADLLRPRRMAAAHAHEVADHAAIGDPPVRDAQGLARTVPPHARRRARRAGAGAGAAGRAQAPASASRRCSPRRRWSRSAIPLYMHGEHVAASRAGDRRRGDPAVRRAALVATSTSRASPR